MKCNILDFFIITSLYIIKFYLYNKNEIKINKNRIIINNSTSVGTAIGTEVEIKIKIIKIVDIRFLNHSYIYKFIIWF